MSLSGIRSTGEEQLELIKQQLEEMIKQQLTKGHQNLTIVVEQSLQVHAKQLKDLTEQVAVLQRDTSFAIQQINVVVRQPDWAHQLEKQINKAVEKLETVIIILSQSNRDHQFEQKGMESFQTAIRTCEQNCKVHTEQMIESQTIVIEQRFKAQLDDFLSEIVELLQDHELQDRDAQAPMLHREIVAENTQEDRSIARISLWERPGFSFHSIPSSFGIRITMSLQEIPIIYDDLLPPSEDDISSDNNDNENWSLACVKNGQLLTKSPINVRDNASTVREEEQEHLSNEVNIQDRPNEKLDEPEKVMHQAQRTRDGMNKDLQQCVQELLQVKQELSKLKE